MRIAAYTLLAKQLAERAAATDSAVGGAELVGWQGEQIVVYWSSDMTEEGVTYGAWAVCLLNGSGEITVQSRQTRKDLRRDSIAALARALREALCAVLSMIQGQRINV